MVRQDGERAEVTGWLSFSPELSSWAVPLGLLPVAIDRCNGLVVDRADEFEYDHTGGHIEAGAALDEALISPFAAR